MQSRSKSQAAESPRTYLATRNVDRMAALRELELEFRYLGSIEADAKRARVDWLAKLMGDLKANLREFWQREYKEDLNGVSR